ncbi:MAG TPA: hypothetical protein VN625_00900, partial [Desulfuromonadaceae bacterium]|nr:hypothetical protein [Desulfuromonadaceae bacterium]
MKIQCSCGAKYEIDVTPGMQPIQFVCGSCGQDYSAFINDQIRRELGEPAAPTPPPPPVPTSSRLKISSAPTPAAASPESSSQLICARHREPAAEQCYVCKKPICPKCMELFGYFCSPFCKSKGSAMDVPVYEGQAFIKEARYSRKVGTITGVVVGILVLFVIAWIWYAWFASVPHAVLSVRFDEKSYSGTSLASDDQVVFLHGGTLARYDLKEKKPVWTLPLVTEQQIDEEMKRDDRQEMEARKNQIPGEYSSVVGPDVHRKWVRMRLESAYSLYGSGKNIWVANSGANTLTHYDWATGNVVKQIALNYPDEIKQRGNELVLLERLNDGEKIVHIDLAGGDMRTEDVHGFNGSFLAGNTTRAGNAAAGGLPLSPYGGGRPMDPQKVAAQAQNLSP